MGQDFVAGSPEKGGVVIYHPLLPAVLAVAAMELEDPHPHALPENLRSMVRDQEVQGERAGGRQLPVSGIPSASQSDARGEGAIIRVPQRTFGIDSVTPGAL